VPPNGLRTNSKSSVSVPAHLVPVMVAALPQAGLAVLHGQRCTESGERAAVASPRSRVPCVLLEVML